MKNVYKLDKLFLTLILILSILLLGTSILSDPVVFGDEKSVVQNGISITYGEQKWTGTQYCEFPGLSISSDKQIKTIQLSYSKNDTSNGTKIQEITTSNITSEPDNTDVSKLFRTTASTSEIESFLRKVKFYCNTAQDVTILLSSNEIPNDVHYYPQTGHFYKYVPYLDISWISAYNASQSSVFLGWKGYLANVISEGENNFILKYSGNNPMESVGWLGGTTAKLNNINTSNVQVASSNIGYWYWSGGPELCATLKPQYLSWTIKGKGREITQKESEYFNYNYNSPNPKNSVFYNCASYQSTIGFSDHMPFDFEFWARADDGISLGLNEPNLSPGEQPYLATIKNHITWNNSPEVPWKGDDVYRSRGYTIEYGDRLYGNSELLEGSAIATVGIGKPVTLKYDVNNSQSTPQSYPDEAVHYDQEFSYDIESFPSPVAPNYKIGGWYTESSEGSKVELSSNVAEAMGNSYSSTLTLYAQWIPKTTPSGSDFSIDPTKLVYDGKTHDVSVSVKSGVSGMGRIAGVYYNGSEELPRDAGSYSITVDLEEGDSFSSYSKLNVGTLVIEKAHIIVSAKIKEIVYGQETPELTFETSGFVEGESFEITADLSCDYVKWQDVGEYNIDIDVSSMSHKNYLFTGVQGKLKVNKGTFDMGSVSLSDGIYIYDSKVKSLSITGDLTPGVSVSYSNNSRKDVGFQTVEAIINVNYNYNDIPLPDNILTAKIIINPATIIITPKDGQYKLYGEDDPEFEYSIEGNIDSQDIVFLGKLSREKGEETGKYKYRMGSLSLQSNSINSNYILNSNIDGKTFEIKEYIAEDIFATLNGNMGDEEWYISTAEITAPDGFLISFDNVISDSVWSRYVTKEDGNYILDQVKYYLRRVDTGAISILKEIGYKQDTTKSIGEIVISNNSWKEFLNNITFGLFFKDKVDVFINVSDSFSGIKKIEYYKSFEPLTLEEVELIPQDIWTQGDHLTVEENGEFIVYARIQDNAGNILYLSSDGIILDFVKPAIFGVEDQKVYYARKNIMIRDEYLSKVELNGKKLPFEGKSLSMILSNNGSTYRIIATDKAENITDCTVTLKNINILDDEIEKSKQLSKDENIIDNIKNSILKIDSILESEYMDLTSRERNQLRNKRKQLFNEFKQLCASKSVIVTSKDDAPDLQVDSRSENVIRSLFTDEDTNNVLYGNKVKIVLEVSPESKYKNIIPIEQSMPSERRIGYYMDISLTKYTEYQNGKSESLKIGNLDESILITIDIPKNLLTSESSRNFSVYKLHAGEVSTLNDIDSHSATITIRTNKFSTFAISYFDENPSWGSNILIVAIFILVLSIIIFIELKFLRNNKIQR